MGVTSPEASVAADLLVAALAQLDFPDVDPVTGGGERRSVRRRGERCQLVAAERGAGAYAMTAIAEADGVSRQTVFTTFGSKASRPVEVEPDRLAGVEKVIYTLWCTAGADLLGAARALADAGASRVQVNVVDDAVAPASQRRIENHPPLPDAFVSLWLPTAHADTRGPVDSVVRNTAGHGARVGAYLVTESCPLANTAFPTPSGERTPGFAQIALLRRRAGQTSAEFLSAWLDDHTKVALETQDTFSYVQNVVVRTLLPEGEPCEGIVEECFPEAAMTDVHAFFDAVGDDERLREHGEAMVASTSRFLDFDRLDVVPTSRYAFE